MTNRIRRQAGVTLVETMISLTLAAIVMVGVMQLFVANSETYNMLAGRSRMQDSARFALNFMGRAVRSAGYKGCYSTNQGVASAVTPANLPYEFDIRTGIQGINSAAPGVWAPANLAATLPSTTGGVYSPPSGIADGTGIDTATIVSGTDILTTRSLSLNDARLLQPPAGQTGPLIVNMPAAGLGFDVDHLAMISDCNNATIFRVTSLALNTPNPGQATIGHDMADADIYQNTFLRLATLTAFETMDAQVNAIDTNIFYIAPGTGVNNRGNTPLSLWRKVGIQVPFELVEGVENLQFLFGQDTDNDGAPNIYVTGNQVTNTVVTLRISVTVNSVDDVGATSAPILGCAIQDCIAGETYDGLIRRTFTETIQLRNQG